MNTVNTQAIPRLIKRCASSRAATETEAATAGAFAVTGDLVTHTWRPCTGSGNPPRAGTCTRIDRGTQLSQTMPRRPLCIVWLSVLLTSLGCKGPQTTNDETALSSADGNGDAQANPVPMIRREMMLLDHLQRRETVVEDLKVRARERLGELSAWGVSQIAQNRRDRNNLGQLVAPIPLDSLPATIADLSPASLLWAGAHLHTEPSLDYVEISWWDRSRVFGVLVCREEKEPPAGYSNVSELGRGVFVWEASDH